jgi:hypothetical protein
LRPFCNGFLKSAVAGGAVDPNMSRSLPIANRPPASWSVPLWLLLVVFGALAAHGQVDTNLIPVLAPPAAEVPPTFWEQHQTAIILGGLALLVFEVIHWSARLRPAAPVVAAPEAEARQALSACASQPEDGKFLSEVSRILRRYLVAAFALPPVEATTAEFCARLGGNERVGAELGDRITRFLRECDERKFSPASASAPLNAVASALDLVERAEARRAASRQIPAAS